MNGLPMLRKSVEAGRPGLAYHAPAEAKQARAIAAETAVGGVRRSRNEERCAVNAGGGLLLPARVLATSGTSQAALPDSLASSAERHGSVKDSRASEHGLAVEQALASSTGAPTKRVRPRKVRLPSARELQTGAGEENFAGQATKPLGRPRKLIGKVRALLLRALRLGYSRNKAAEVCRIAASTITRETRLDAELARRVAEEEDFGRVFKEVYDLLYFPGRVVCEAQPVVCCPEFEVEKQVLIAGGLNAEEVRCYRLATPQEARRYRKMARHGRSKNPELFEKGGRLAIPRGAKRGQDKA